MTGSLRRRRKTGGGETLEREKKNDFLPGRTEAEAATDWQGGGHLKEREKKTLLGLKKKRGRLSYHTLGGKRPTRRAPKSWGGGEGAQKKRSREGRITFSSMFEEISPFPGGRRA